MKKKRSVFDPVKEQFLILVDYVSILDTKKYDMDGSFEKDIYNLIELIESTCRQCEIYLKYKCILFEKGKS